MLRRISSRFLLVPILLLCLGRADVAQAEGFYGLAQTLKGETAANKNTSIKPTKFEANAKGGVIQLRMPDTSGNTFGDYEFKWEFLDSIAKIEPGKKYRFKVTGRRLAGTSEKNTCIVYPRSTNAGSVLAKQAGIEKPDNGIKFDVVTTAVDAYPPSKHNPYEGTIALQYDSATGTTYFGFQFQFGSHPFGATSKSCTYDVTYVYKANFIAPTPDSLSCPNLYGLGVNIGILEYGTLTDAKSDFMGGFIDHAVALMKTNDCIPATEVKYLEDLKTRMLKQERAKSFAAEVSAFRQKLTTIINENCECACDDK